MQATPKGMRLHIGIYGKRNVGKSTLLNILTQQAVSIVSDTAGTTTDPVEKAMEWLPIGPVLFIDTAGLDDEGALGQQRIQASRKIMNRTDMALIVTDNGTWGAFEEALYQDFKNHDIPVVAIFTKCDIVEPHSDTISTLQKRGIPTCFITRELPAQARNEIRDAVITQLPEAFLQSPAIAGDLLPPGGIALLVVPIDLEAPKGRLILPQVQTIRDLLDHDACALVVKERELRAAIHKLAAPPDLVITDSQAFLKVAADTPTDVPLTSFSILFARIKGDLPTFVAATQIIDQLQSGDRILIAEACTHHQIGDDIGRIKIPRWLTQYTGSKLQIDHVQGNDFPSDVSPYRLVIHCGSCTFNRRHLLSRIAACQDAGVPITNYGITIAKSLGILDRALSPFPLLKDAL